MIILTLPGLTLSLPSGWHEVTLAQYIDYQSWILPMSTGWRLAHTAALLSGQPVEVFTTNMARALDAFTAVPWLQELPEADGPVPLFTHEGKQYRHLGNLETMNVEQTERVLDTTAAFGNDPALGFHLLLAALYAEVGVPQSKAEWEQTGQAFATLPVSVAWPALAAFITNSLPLALRIQQLSRLQSEVQMAREALTDALVTSPGGGLRGWLRSTQLRLASRLLRSVS